MSYKRGDVVLVPFPFTDLTTTKQRPALVISSDEFNATHQDVIIAAITGQIPSALSPDDYEIPPAELTNCGLLKASIVKLSKVVTLHHQLVIRRLGTMPNGSLGIVLAGIRRLF